MENFTLTLDNQVFNFEKTKYQYYQIIPFVEDLSIENLSNALITQKGYYISCFGSYNPMPILELNEDGPKIHPFNIKERCFFAIIKPSKNNK